MSAYIVQDAESGLFLMPFEGDVGYTKWAHEAGRFDELAEAVDTAEFVLSGKFFVTEVAPSQASTTKVSQYSAGLFPGSTLGSLT